MASYKKNQFYNFKSVNKLKSFLFMSEDYKSSYRIYCTNKGLRLVEEPIDKTKELHKRIFKFLQLIDTPSYLISSTKGKCNIDNARLHVNNNYFVTFDISKFFPNCCYERVFDFFVKKMNMSHSCAKLMSDIVTVDNSAYNFNEDVKRWYLNANSKQKFLIPDKHLPTGSCLSQKLSFLIFQNMFDEISNYCKLKNFEFSVYVDDITISSKGPISKIEIRKVKHIVEKYGLPLNSKKTKICRPNDVKKITGVIINKRHELRAPNNKHQEIISYKNKILCNDEVVNDNVFKGKINYVQRIEGVNKFRNLINL